jgi:outer membrane scaffolding protein for murein synthesis (MipA/OmpV family)
VRIIAAALAALASATIAHAQTSAQQPQDTQGWSGILGGGLMAFPKYTGGATMQTWPLPIAYVDYDGWFRVDLYRASAYFWSSADKKQGLAFAVEPRIGFQSNDGPRLAGMARRKSTAFGGVTYNAENDLGSMSLGYFTDLGEASRGGYVDLLLTRELHKDARWELSATFEATRVDAKATNYYFGVTPAEATATRAAYSPGAATNLTFWLTGQYNISKDYALMFGANIARLGSSAAASPIVERRDVPFLYFGFGKNL